MTSKEKIDKLLGIESNQSIDDFLDDISLDVDKLSASFDNIQEEVHQNIQNVDNKIKEIDGSSILEIDSLTSSMKEIEDMIILSKKMFKHIYENRSPTAYRSEAFPCIPNIFSNSTESF